MKKDAMNYMKGELTLMPKKAVADVYYKLLVNSGKKVVREDLDKYGKETLINKYVSLRYKNMVWGK